jgi:hypothetical protein
MSKLNASRGAQYVLSADFTFNFDDTMVATDGSTQDFGVSNTASTAWDIINLPEGAVVVGGAIVTETAFSDAFTVTLGDSATPARYLSSTAITSAGLKAITPTGYRGKGENLRLTATASAAETSGKATVRVDFIIPDRVNEAYPN